MIEKLSDQMMREIAWEHYFGAKNRAIAKDGMRLARDYYDAQIDKQAKTMEELLKIFKKNHYISKSKKQELLKDKIREWLCEYIRIHECYVDEYDFCDGVMMFLAAGGTIKDGE